MRVGSLNVGKVTERGRELGLGEYYGDEKGWSVVCVCVCVCKRLDGRGTKRNSWGRLQVAP